MDGAYRQTPRDEVYDWLTEEQRYQSAEVIPRTTRPVSPVNPVTGHAMDCVCPRCPGWYEARQRGIVVDPMTQQQPPMVQARRGSALLDQVIPVCCLLAMVTVCGTVLLPVAMPMVAMGVVMVIAMVVAVVVGALVALYLLGVIRRESRNQGGQSIRGELVRQRRGWRRR